MPIETLLFWYVAGLLAALAGVAFYYEQRSRSFAPTHSEDRIFRCEKCGFVYTDDPDMDRSRCSQCATMNDAIRF